MKKQFKVESFLVLYNKMACNQHVAIHESNNTSHFFCKHLDLVEIFYLKILEKIN
jgi:hypothetical protein